MHEKVWVRKKDGRLVNEVCDIGSAKTLVEGGEFKICTQALVFGVSMSIFINAHDPIIPLILMVLSAVWFFRDLHHDINMVRYGRYCISVHEDSLSSTHTKVWRF